MVNERWWGDVWRVWKVVWVIVVRVVVNGIDCVVGFDLWWGLV